MDRNLLPVADSEGEIHRMPDVARLESKDSPLKHPLSRKKCGKRERRGLRAHPGSLRMRAEHPVSKRLAARAVVIEKRNTKGMTASAKGTVDEPGRNLVILGTGWGGPERMLGYKARERMEVDPAWMSRTCSECGAVDATARHSQAELVYANAARNIPASGTGASARSEALALATSATREMDAGRASRSPCIRFPQRFIIGGMTFGTAKG